MTKIKIKDLPEDHRITKEEISKVMGGILLTSSRWYSPVLQDQIIMGDPTAPGSPIRFRGTLPTPIP